LNPLSLLSRILLVAVPCAAAPAAHAVTILSESFDDVSSLFGAGWVATNNSVPFGASGWFQGVEDIFPAQSGAGASYVAANFESTDFGGNISNWLLTPTLLLHNGDAISFYTRSAGSVPDRLEVRLSTSADSIDVGFFDDSLGDFTTLLLTVNPALDSSYPSDWTQFVVSISGLSGPSLGRLGFRYFVPNTSVNGDYIGIDTLSVSSVPEPSTAGLLGLGVLALVALRSRGKGKRLGRAALCALVATAGLTAARPAFAAATITLVNFDGPGEGFNDPTPVAPVGGNSGTTLGEQRQIAVLSAAEIWAATLTSSVPIWVRVQFNSLTCNAARSVPGTGGPRFVIRDLPNLVPNRWYPGALADKLTGVDNAGGEDHITVQFNSSFGQIGSGCASAFYLGLDDNHGALTDLVSVAVHEIAHGLGFFTTTNGITGAFLDGRPNRFDDFLFDITANEAWSQMTDGERVASAVNTRKLAWNGPNVTAAVSGVLQAGTPELTVLAPAAVAGSYLVGSASFGPPLTSAGVSGQLMPIVGNSVPGPGCSPLTGVNILAVNGNVALIDRGVCPLANQVKNAQHAGAIAVIIVDNVAGSPPQNMEGTDPTITIPSVMITQGDGATLKIALRFRSRTRSGVIVDLGVDPNVPTGADAAGRMLMFTPNPFQGGVSASSSQGIISVMHWDASATPGQLMETPVPGDVSHSVLPPQDLTFRLLQDLGW
jgi:hypothetical protein